MPITAIYEGELALASGPFTRMVLGRGTEESKSHKIQITFQKDKTGAEVIRYVLDGSPIRTLVLTKDGQYDIGDSGINLRPKEEAGAPSTLGFGLPPSVSNTFFRKEQKQTVLPGEPCSKDEANCINATVRVGFSGTILRTKWDKHSNLMTVQLGGVPRLTWVWYGQSQGFPQQVKYTEVSDARDVLSSARYTLVRISDDQSNIPISELVGSKAKVTVMKNATGYGPYSPAQGEPWKFHEKQDKIWQTMNTNDQSNSFSWIPVGTVSAVLLILVITISLRLQKRK